MPNTYVLPTDIKTAQTLGTVVRLTVTKFKPFILSVSSFALANVGNVYIFMPFYDFYLLPSQFCNIIVYTANSERHMQLTGRCAPW